MTEPNLLTLQEFCQRNRVSRAGAYNLINGAKLHTVKHGSRTLIPIWAERRWLASIGAIEATGSEAAA